MRQMDNPLDMLESIADALVASEASRVRRNAGAGRLIAPPPPGTPLLVSLALAVEHTGIYLGNNRVAELRCDGAVAEATLTEFINGDSEDPLSFRNGTRIFAACDAKTRKPIGARRVWQTAHEAVRRGASRPYDILLDNCHLFVAACAAGILPDDPRFDDLLDGDVASIGRLERSLERSLNKGRRMAWCAVARSKEEFNYKLTFEKVARLRLEGKIK